MQAILLPCRGNFKANSQLFMALMQPTTDSSFQFYTLVLTLLHKD